MESVDLLDWWKVQLSIVLVLFMPGCLIAILLRWSLIEKLRPWLDPLTAIVLTGFILSLTLNIVTAFALSIIDVPLGYGVIMIGACCAICLVIWLKRNDRRIGIGAVDRWLWSMVLVVFVVMSVNGGLIGVLADSWWHMAYANQIQEAGSVFVDRHHLTGQTKELTEFAYEPGWHINLALVSLVSNAPLPLIWHLLGAWCSALAMLGYFFFARTLTGSRFIALGSIVLFAVVLGGINGYLRVSPWPGSVGYVLMYIALAVIFIVFDSAKFDRGNARHRAFPMLNAGQLFSTAPLLMSFMVLVLVVVGFIHLAEGLWLVSALAFYSYVATLGPTPTGSDLNRDGNALGHFWLWFFGAWALLVFYGHPGYVYDVATVLGTLMLFRLLHRVWSGSGKTMHGNSVKVLIGIAAAFTLYMVVDVDHFRKLFRPDVLEAGYSSFYIPEYVKGYFGNWLNLPKWEHQLRAGLLFSGLIGVVLSIWLFLQEHTRATVFLFACSMFVMMVFVSPYLFTFFGSLVKTTGVYRFQVLIFHPIILMLSVSALMERMTASRNETLA